MSTILLNEDVNQKTRLQRKTLLCNRHIRGFFSVKQVVDSRSTQAIWAKRTNITKERSWGVGRDLVKPVSHE